MTRRSRKNGALAGASDPGLIAAFAKVGSVPVALTQAASPGIWDARTCVYNWKPTNTAKYRAALGKAVAGTGFCHIACVGDSTTAGQGATVSTSYPAYLRAALTASGLPSGGTGAVFLNQGTTGTLVDSRLTLDPAYAMQGSGFNLHRQCAVTAKVMTFVSDVAGTVLEIAYLQNSSPFTYAIDGAGAVTVTPSGASALGKTTVTGLANTVHTVVITSTSAVLFYPLYVMIRQATSGVLVSNAGVAGSKSNEWQLSGYFTARDEAVYLGAHLTIFCIEINDVINAVTPAVFKTNVDAALAQFLTTGDVVIATSNNLDTGTYPQDFTPFNQALYELADSRGVPLIDYNTRSGPWAGANTLGLMFDAFHPAAPWYADKARHLARLLTA